MGWSSRLTIRSLHQPSCSSISRARVEIATATPRPAAPAKLPFDDTVKTVWMNLHAANNVLGGPQRFGYVGQLRREEKASSFDFIRVCGPHTHGRDASDGGTSHERLRFRRCNERRLVIRSQMLVLNRTWSVARKRHRLLLDPGCRG